MTRYDYINETVNNIKDYIDENIDYIKEYSFDELYDELWTADSVTGNASGSYYCNAYKAEEALAGSWELLKEALENFGLENVNILEKGAEYCDVTIRCYLLSECLAEALEDPSYAGLFPEEG